MTLNSEITLDAVILNGGKFAQGVTLERYEELLGPPSRSDTGPPAPYGHRNNVIHFYDDFGLRMNEHHATYLIQSINFLFEPDRDHFPTKCPYTGTLLVCGVDVRAAMEFQDFARKCGAHFTPHLGHAYYHDGESIWLQFEVYSPKRRGGPHRELISVLAVGFRGAHRLESDPSPPSETQGS